MLYFETAPKLVENTHSDKKALFASITPPIRGLIDLIKEIGSVANHEEVNESADDRRHDDHSHHDDGNEDGQTQALAGSVTGIRSDRICNNKKKEYNKKVDQRNPTE